MTPFSDAKRCHLTTERVSPVTPELSSNYPRPSGVGVKGVQPASTPAPSGAAQSRFPEFWQHYPKRTSPHDARRAYDAVLAAHEATEQELIEGAIRYAATCDRREGGRYIRSPTAWLRGGNWKDDPLQPRKQRRDKPMTAARAMLAAGHGGRDE